jgi:hypothetical protein
LHDRKLLEALKGRGIGKFVAFEVPLSLAEEGLACTPLSC